MQTYDKDFIYAKYHRSINMSYSELLAWSKNPCSKLASLSRGPIKRNLHLLKLNKSQWHNKEIKYAIKTLSFLARHKGQPSGKPVKNCNLSKRTIALMNWAYNPNQNMKGGLS